MIMVTTAIKSNNDRVLFNSYWNQLRGLSDQLKLQLAIRLTADVSERAKSAVLECESEEAYTQRFINTFAGAWHGNETADEIIQTIKTGFHSTEQPKVVFD